MGSAVELKKSWTVEYAELEPAFALFVDRKVIKGERHGWVQSSSGYEISLLWAKDKIASGYYWSEADHYWKIAASKKLSRR